MSTGKADDEESGEKKVSRELSSQPPRETGGPVWTAAGWGFAA